MIDVLEPFSCSAGKIGSAGAVAGLGIPSAALGVLMEGTGIKLALGSDAWAAESGTGISPSVVLEPVAFGLLGFSVIFTPSD
jgi:hypothetical protein